MAPEGGIVAVDLQQGAELWRSGEAAKPLAVSGPVLVGQAEATGPALRLVRLDADKGDAVGESVVPLPEGVAPLVQEGPAAAFTARVVPEAGQTATVAWEFVARPL